MDFDERLSPYRLIAFDLDGTLVDSVRTAGSVLNAMRASRGAAPLDTGGFGPLMSYGAGTLVAAGLEGCARVPEEDVAEFRARYAAAPASAQELFPGAAAVLSQMRDAGLALAVCTNKPRRLSEKVLADTGLAPLLSALSAGDDPGVAPKPAPAQLASVADRLGATPESIAFIGDSHLDQQAARAYGADFFLALYGYGTGQERPAECRGSFASLYELPTLLGLTRRSVMA